jgi:hypothetical protein
MNAWIEKRLALGGLIAGTCPLITMERESPEYKIVMDDDSDTEVVDRLAPLDLASAAYMAVGRYPADNIMLRERARIIKRHDGEPKPWPPPDPNLKVGPPPRSRVVFHIQQRTR